jgi:hypothetical protein
MNSARKDEDRPIEMILPDSYHRTKRAALAFSAVLIILSVASHSGLSLGPGDASTGSRDAISAGGASISVGHDWLLLLMWLAALYHVTLFWLEYSTARTVNCAWMRADAAQSFEQRLNEVHHRATVMMSLRKDERDGRDLSPRGLVRHARPVAPEREGHEMQRAGGRRAALPLWISVYRPFTGMSRTKMEHMHLKMCGRAHFEAAPARAPPPPTPKETQEW